MAKEKDIGLIKPSEVASVFNEDEKSDTTISQPAAAPRYDEEDLAEESDLSYEEGIEDALESTDFADYEKDSVLQKKEDTRSRLAIIFMVLTFVVFIFAMLIAVLDGILRKVSIVDNLATVIPLISGVFLGTLGFVLGYYFKESTDDNEK